MKPSLIATIFFGLLLSLHGAEPEWSASVNGVRGRLALERQKDSPFLKVFIEFQNTSDIAGIKEIRFSPDRLHTEVTDGSGIPLKTPIGAYDGTSPTWDSLGLPFEGVLRFRISFPGMGYRPETDRTIIDLGPDTGWVIPDGSTYFLSGTLTIPKQEGDHPHSDWNGTLTFPKIPIPTK